jgi:hypothetical protein
MFCAKCGSALSTQTDGAFVCPAGLVFTLDLSKRLRERYGDSGDNVGPRGSGKLGRDWFCPGCGIRLVNANDDPTCSQCGLSLRPLVHSLIERHPHPDDKGGFV